ncbi:MAG TPA: FHA domain-containing protein [Micromonosporaceae bacterium]|nr:FHA domain-containing protein [Micromonosporaceae bacterium]
MAAAGLSTDVTIPFDVVSVGATGVGEVAQRVVAALATTGLAVAPAGSRTYRCTRRYRPTWAVLLGLLFVRRAEECTLEFAEHQVRVTGRLPGSTLDIVRSALRPPATPRYGFRAVAAGEGSPPGRLLDAPARTLPATVHKGALAALATPAPATTVGQLVAVFDTGEQLPVGPLAIIGRDPARDPAAGPAEAAAALVKLTQAGFSVSKTHLAVGTDERGVWVLDRHSTNGTVLCRSTGEVVHCEPGHPVYIGPGDTVRFGDHSFTVCPAERTERVR